MEVLDYLLHKLDQNTSPCHSEDIIATLRFQKNLLGVKHNDMT